MAKKKRKQNQGDKANKVRVYVSLDTAHQMLFLRAFPEFQMLTDADIFRKCVSKVSDALNQAALAAHEAKKAKENEEGTEADTQPGAE